MKKQTSRLTSIVTMARQFSLNEACCRQDQATRGYYHSQNIGGPAGELPVGGVCLSIPQITARRMLNLRNQIRLFEPRLGFSISYNSKKLDIRYELEEVDCFATERLGVPSVFWDEPDIDRKSDIGVDTSEVIFSPEGDIWFQLITDGPGVAQILIETFLLEEIARGRPTPRMKRG